MTLFVVRGMAKKRLRINVSTIDIANDLMNTVPITQWHCFVYEYINDNGIAIYIGQTTKSITDRTIEHYSTVSGKRWIHKASMVRWVEVLRSEATTIETGLIHAAHPYGNAQCYGCPKARNARYLID